MVASAEGQMLQAAYEALDVFEGAIRARACGDLSEEGRDEARTAMGNVLDEMAEAVYRERRRVAALRTALVEIKKLTDAGPSSTMVRTALDLAWRIGRIAERHIPVTMEEADAPGQSGEEGQG
jgi:hypothetical protein